MTGEVLLRVQGLTVTAGGMRLVDDVGFGVPAVGTTALLGRNGAGKTTTVRAILGLAPRGGRASGVIELAGERIDRLPTHAIARAGIGYVPEDRVVFAGLTVAENLRLAEAGGAPAYDRVYALFPDLEHRGHQIAGSLSGGQQQMLAIGRVLLGTPRLIVVDEPTKGLAPRVVAEVAAALDAIAQTTPILLVEQNLAVIRRLARHATVLSHGQVAWSGPAPDLLQETTMTRSLLGVA